MTEKAVHFPNKRFFESLRRGGDITLKAVALMCGDISLVTLRKLMRGEPVSLQTIQDIAEALKCSPIDLIERDPASFIPDDPKWFQSLKHGYFIDHDRRRKGSKHWYYESVELKRAKASRGKNKSQFTLDGVIENQFGEVFDVVGIRLNDRHFSLTGSSRRFNDSFDASFTMRAENVLCGTWSGVNHVDKKMAIYRIFLSFEPPLSLGDLQQLTANHKIEEVFETNSFGESDKQ